MITAQAARGMFQQPLYTLDEIQKVIEKIAPTRNYTCFEANRWDDQLTKSLEVAGFKVTINTIGDVIVSWAKE